MAAIENIGAVAGGTGEDHRGAGPAVARRANAIMDPLVERFVETIIKAGIEIDPAFVFIG